MTKKPFKVLNGKPFFSNAGTSEGVKKAWETRKTGGGVQEQPARISNAGTSEGVAVKKSAVEDDDAEAKYGAKGNSENFESASKGRGGIRVDEEFDHKNGSGKHVKLTIQNWKDGQKDIKMNLPKSVYAALSADQWQSNKEMERQFDGEDFHIKHGYEPVSQPDGIRKKYGKGSEPDIVNGLIGQSLARAKSYYTNAKNFDDGSTAQHALKAKAEDIIKEIHDKHHPDLLKAKASYVAPLGNRDYAILLNSFRDGLLKNYRYDVQDMLDEVADYASNGDPLPDELRERYEEWLDDQY